MHRRPAPAAPAQRLTSLRAKVVTTTLVLVASVLPVEFVAAGNGAAVAGVGSLGGLAGSSGQSGPSGAGGQSARAAAVPVNYGRYFLSTDHLNSPAVQAARWPLLIAQSDQDSAARQVKAANPSAVTTVFYANPLFLRQTDPDGVTTAVRNSDAFASHPEWFLLDAGGRRIPATAFDNQDYAADISSKTYQSAAISFLKAKIAAQGWDGVFLDDTNPTPSYTFTARPAKFPADTSWQSAELTLITKLCKAVKAMGKRCYVNLGQRNTTWAQSIAKQSTGPMTEFFVGMNPALSGGQTVATVENGHWIEQLTWAAWAEQNTQQQVVHASTANAAVTTYALASYLLISSGKGAFAANRDYGDESEGKTFPKSLTDARRLGAPTSMYVEDESGVYYRTFTNGNVVVNPHESAITFRGVKYGAASGVVTLY